MKVVYFIGINDFNPVRDFINSLSQTQRSKIFRIFQLIEEHGISMVSTHVKKLKDTKLWEIRILGKDNIRIIYVIPTKSTILVLNGFIKKKQKTPLKEILAAELRYKEWLKKHVDK